MRRDWLSLAVIDEGLLSPEQVREVQTWNQGQGRGLMEKLYRSGLVSDRMLHRLLLDQGAQDGTPELEAGLPPPAALGALDRATADKTRAIPLRIEPPRLVVGMLDPSDTAALERIAFFSGMLVEPRAVRAPVLFEALRQAYAIEKVVPDPRAFTASPAYVGDDEIPDDLPPPSANLPEVRTTGIPSAEVRARTPAADPSTSPLAAQLVSAAGGLPDYAEPPDAQAPTFGWVRSAGPSTPALEDLPQPDPETSPLVLRDTIPPQILPLLAHRFRVALLFLVRDEVAVGWDGVGPDVQTERVRDVLIPLTAPSAFARAWAWGMVAAGSPREPTTIERILFRFLGQDAPSAFVVVPVRVGSSVNALIYVDLAEGTLDDQRLIAARQVGSALADAIAPLVAENTLFG